MQTKVVITDFEFIKTSSGQYRVIYTSPKTGKQWATHINDMTLIDATKNEEEPKRKDLERLKWLCKNN